MKAEAVADPDVDLPLLREHQDCQDALAENLAGLELPDELQAAVEENPANLTSLIEAARRMREAVVATGNTPDSVGEATQNSLEPLLAAARLLYPPAREVERLKAELRENLAGAWLTLRSSGRSKSRRLRP